MDLLDKYRNLQKEVNSLRNIIADLKDDLDIAKEDYAENKENLQKLKNDNSDGNIELLNNAIRTKIKKLKAELEGTLEELESQIEILKKDYETRLQDAVIDVNKTVKGADTLSEVYNRIQELEPEIAKFGQMVKVDEVNESYKDMLTRAKELSKQLKEYKKLPDNKSYTIAEALSLRDILINLENPKIAVGLLTAYIIVATLLVLKLPILTLTGITGFTLYSLREVIKLQKIQLQLTLALERLKSSYKNNQESYKNSYNLALSEAQDKCTQQYNEQLNLIISQQEEAKKDFEKKKLETEDLRNSEEFLSTVSNVTTTNIQNLEEEIRNLLEEITHLEERIKTSEQELQIKDEERKKCKVEIENKYQNNLSPGTDRLLQKELFLGFSKDEDISSLEYNGEPTCILYTGESVQELISLVMMIFVQIICNTSIGSLKFYIVDTEFGASDFAIFKQGKLSEVVHTCSTENDATKTIDKLHTELQNRNTTILKKAKDINEFNKLMLSRNSLTTDYRFLIIQNSGKVIFNDNKFEQLCKTGAKVGIIPIVFVSYDNMQRCITDAKENEAKEYARLFKSVKGNFFRFTTATKDILKYDNDSIKARINNLERIKR